MPRFVSIGDVARAGLDLRVWCLRCARGRQMTVDEIGKRRARESLRAAGLRFRCADCKSGDMVIVLPASRLPKPREIPAEPDDPNFTGERAVTMFFHLMRSKPKPDPGADRIAGVLLKQAQEKLEREKRKPRLVAIDGHPVRGKRIKL